MSILKPVRMLGTFAILIGVPLIAANAQTQAPARSQPATPRAATQTETAPVPQTSPVQTPSTTTHPDKSTAAPANPLVGLAVVSADGTKLGSVHSVATGPDGKVTAIHIKTGGFLGMGGKL